MNRPVTREDLSALMALADPDQDAAVIDTDLYGYTVTEAVRYLLGNWTDATNEVGYNFGTDALMGDIDATIAGLQTFRAAAAAHLGATAVDQRPARQTVLANDDFPIINPQPFVQFPDGSVGRANPA